MDQFLKVVKSSYGAAIAEAVRLRLLKMKADLPIAQMKQVLGEVLNSSSQAIADGGGKLADIPCMSQPMSASK